MGLTGAENFHKLVGFHMASQGLISMARGDGFVQGAVSGFIGKISGSILQGIESDVTSSVIAGVFGGVASKATGGNFLQGALQAATVHLYNQRGGKAAEKDDPWNAKNVKGTRRVKVSKGSPYENIYDKGEWSTYKAGSVDLTDFIPQKRAVWVIKLVTFTTDEARLIEYRTYQDYDIYEYDVIYDLNNGNVENLMYDYGSRTFINTVPEALPNTQRFEVKTRTCWFGALGC